MLALLAVSLLVVEVSQTTQDSSLGLVVEDTPTSFTCSRYTVVMLK